MQPSDPSWLIGSRASDAADVRPCCTEGYTLLAPGLSIHDWKGADRVVPAPPQAEEGPYAELRLAPSPAATVVAAVGRRRYGSEQEITEVVRDLLGSSIYVVRATGVRIKDRHSDSRLVGSTPGLRKEGEYARSRLVRQARDQAETGLATTTPMSDEWTTLDAYFEEAVAAVEIPSESALRTIKADWCLVVSVPRIEALEEARALTFEYVGTGVVRFRDLLRVRDVSGHRAGGRFLYFLARELAHDVFSVHRQQGFKAWLRFVTATVGCLSSLGGIGWLLSQLSSIFG